MRKILITLILPLILSSCIRYSDFEATQMGYADNSVKTEKRGIACVTNILGLITYGDSSVEKAKKDGRITKVTFVDASYKDFQWYIPFFQKGCTMVKGE